MKHTLFLSFLTLTCILPAWALTAEQEAKLLPADGADEGFFGWSVALDANTAILGAPSTTYASDPGSAYAFTRSAGVWTEPAKLLASDGVEEDSFGRAVAIVGDTAIIGAPDDDDNGYASGSAYVFTRSGTVWTEQAKLLASDGQAGGGFGESLAVEGDTLIIGAYGDTTNGSYAGAAYVFTRSGGVWTEQAKLLASDGTASDAFGLRVAIAGDSVIIGAYEDDDNGSQSGSAYLFTRAGGVWTEQAKLIASDGEAGDEFGKSVTIDGDSVIIGARLDDDNGSSTGSAYVFTRAGGVWTEQAKLTAADGEGGDHFGMSVTIDGDTAVIGAYFDDDNGSASGSAYVFTRAGGVWTEQAKLIASDGESSEQFGHAVALDADKAVIGAPQDDDNGFLSGSAYVFRLQPDPDVPATGGVGTALLLLAVLGTGVYFTRRRAGA